MATATKPHNQSVGNVLDLPAQSLAIVRKNWKMFALVNIFMLVSAIAALPVSNHADSQTNLQYNGLFVEGFTIEKDVTTSVLIGLAIFSISFLVSVFLYAMMTTLHLRTTKRQQPTADDLIGTAKKFWIRQLALYAVMAVIIIVGFILLIVPGVIAVIRLCLAPYIMFEKDLGVIDSIKASNAFVSQNMSEVSSAILLLLGISLVAGAISFIPYVGPLLATIISIVYSLILVLRYRELNYR